MYGSNNMKKSVVFNNQFTPKLGGQFELESGGQFDRFFHFRHRKQTRNTKPKKYWSRKILFT
jgi:hypothetical protein